MAVAHDPDAVRREVFAALDATLTAELDGPLGVAVSGGGDSVALLHLADAWARARGRGLEVATVDHGLRPESASEAEAVAAAAASLGRSHQTLRWTGWDGRGNLQAEARDARRRLLAGWAAERGADAVALGHTLDDQAETVLMRLGRSAGVDGLSGMSARTRAEGLIWLRPLLGIRREALRDWLRGRGRGWVDDPSNENPRFNRVRARRALVALADIGVTEDALAATAKRMQGVRAALDHGVGALAEVAADWGLCGELRLALAPLRAAPRELSRRLLRAGLTRASGSGYGPRGGAEGRLLTSVLGLGLGGGKCLHGCLIRPHGPGHVVISREVAALAAMTREEMAGEPEDEDAADALWDGRFEIEATAPLREAVVGPLGEAGARRLADLSDQGVWRAPDLWRSAPRAARLTTPALWRRGELEAAPVAGFGAGLTARFAAADAGWPSMAG